MSSARREVLTLVVDGKDFFAEWSDALADMRARADVRRRIDRVEGGNFGDHASVGGGVWELRIHAGAGYRVYYGEDGPRVVLLLCGGKKDTQRGDIGRAQRLWKKYRSSNDQGRAIPRISD